MLKPGTIPTVFDWSKQNEPRRALKRKILAVDNDQKRYKINLISNPSHLLRYFRFYLQYSVCIIKKMRTCMFTAVYVISIYPQ